MKKILLLILILITGLIFATSNKEIISDGKISVFTSVIPQKYLVDRIGGDFVNTNFLVGPGASPATYQPTPSQIKGLSRADILFVIGVPFEKAYLNKIIETLPKLKVVDTSIEIQKRTIDGHSHDDEHQTESPDPHIWLSPVLAKAQSKTILDALIEASPENKEYFTDRYNSLIKDLDNTTKKIHSMLDPYKGRILFVYHPSFGYFTDEFGLIQEAIETGGKEPAPGQLNEIINEAIADNVKFIVVQPEFSQKSAKTIAKAINGTVTTLNPLALDYIDNLKSIAKEIEKAYK